MSIIKKLMNVPSIEYIKENKDKIEKMGVFLVGYISTQQYYPFPTLQNNNPKTSLSYLNDYKTIITRSFADNELSKTDLSDLPVFIKHDGKIVGFVQSNHVIDQKGGPEGGHNRYGASIIIPFYDKLPEEIYTILSRLFGPERDLFDLSIGMKVYLSTDKNTNRVSGYKKFLEISIVTKGFLDNTKIITKEIIELSQSIIEKWKNRKINNYSDLNSYEGKRFEFDYLVEELKFSKSKFFF